MNDPNQQRLHATIEGRVQGVGFRAFVQREALKLGLTGWVRNRWDGSVETLVEGDQGDLEGFLLVLRRGPAASNVSNIRTSWGSATGEFKSFQIRMTA